MASNYFDNLRKMLPNGSLNFSDQTLSNQLGSALTVCGNSLKNSVNSCSAFATVFTETWPELPGDLFDNEVVVDKDAIVYFGNDDPFHALIEVIDGYGGGPEEVGEDLMDGGMSVTTSNGLALQLYYKANTIYASDGFEIHPVWQLTRLNPPNKLHLYWPTLRLTADDEVTYISIADVAASLAENAAICDVLFNSVSAILNRKDEELASVLLSLENSIDNSWESAKTVASQVYASYCNGGLYGVVRYIVDFVKGNASVSVSEDGLLQFTDNSTLVPQSFIAGLTSVITASVGAIASLIISIWQPVIGMMVMGLTELFRSIFGTITYSENVDAHAKISTSTRSVGSLSPYGVIQGRSYFSTEEWERIILLLPYIELENTFFLSVPGGQLIVAAPVGETVSFEFHPDCVDRRAWIRDSFINFYTQQGDDPSFGFGTIDISWRFPQLLNAYKHRKVPVFQGETHGCNATLELTGSAYDFNVYTPVDDVDANGILSLRDTYEIGDVIACNFLLFFVYMQCLRSSISPASLICKIQPTADPSQTTVVAYYSITDHTVTPLLSTLPTPRQADLALDYVAHISYWHAHYMLSGKNYTHATATTGFDLFEDLANAADYLTRCTSPETIVGPQNSIISQFCSDGLVLFSSWYLRPSLLTFIYSVNGVTSKDELLHNVSGEPVPLLGPVEYMVAPPKVKTGSAVRAAIIGAIIAVVSIAVIVAVKFSVGKRLAVKRAQIKAQAEAKWDQAKLNPTKENITAYRKAVRKNNAFAKVFGGTTLSKNGYWDSPSGGDGEKIASKIGSIVNDGNESNTVALQDVITLIKPS